MAENPYRPLSGWAPSDLTYEQPYPGFDSSQPLAPQAPGQGGGALSQGMTIDMVPRGREGQGMSGPPQPGTVPQQRPMTQASPQQPPQAPPQQQPPQQVPPVPMPQVGPSGVPPVPMPQVGPSGVPPVPMPQVGSGPSSSPQRNEGLINRIIGAVNKSGQQAQQQQLLMQANQAGMQAASGQVPGAPKDPLEAIRRLMPQQQQQQPRPQGASGGQQSPFVTPNAGIPMMYPGAPQQAPQGQPGQQQFARGGFLRHFARGGYPRMIGQAEIGHGMPMRMPFGRGSYTGSGAGSGRSDNIEARLSPHEFVFDAETVSMLGDGSPDEGARRLEELRHNIRAHKGKQLAKGKFSPDAKDPEDYLPRGRR